MTETQAPFEGAGMPHEAPVHVLDHEVKRGRESGFDILLETLDPLNGMTSRTVCHADHRTAASLAIRILQLLHEDPDP